MCESQSKEDEEVKRSPKVVVFRSFEHLVSWESLDKDDMLLQNILRARPTNGVPKKKRKKNGDYKIFLVVENCALWSCTQQHSVCISMREGGKSFPSGKIFHRFL